MAEKADEKISMTLGSLWVPQTRLEARKRASYRARFVRAGRPKRADGSPADFTIQESALSNAAEKGLFDDKAVFLNHGGFWEGPDLGNLVGRTGPVACYNPADKAVEGDILLLDTPAGQVARTIIDEVLSSPGPDIGLSMVFYPIWEAEEGPAHDRPQLRTITGIKHVESVDLVFQPAADGRILEALQGRHIGRPQQNEKGQTGEMTTKSNNVEAQPVNAGMQEPVGGVTFLAATGENRAAVQPAGDSIEPWVTAAAQSAISMILANSGLPETARQRLAAANYATPAELQTAIEAERAYLASLEENQVIQIGGQPPRSPQITGVRTSLDRIQLALESLLAGSPTPAGVQPLTGVRELYHLLSGDYEMTGMFKGDRIQFANVNSSTMANMVANVLNKRVAQEFVNYNMWWQPIVVEEDFQSLQAIKWTILGGVGELPTVAEGAAYTELSWDDSAESGTFIKKGGYLGLTLETIDKDETGRLRGAPRALAQAAWLTISKTISAVFTVSSGTGPALADTYALFETAHHANLGSTALSLTTWNAARLAMRKQTEGNSSERLGALTTPKYLLVPPNLEMTALQVLASESDYTYAVSNTNASPVNPNASGNSFNERMNIARQRVIVVDLWTDTNDWAAVCDPRMYPTIGVGYRYGRSPEIFSIASPTAGLMFSNDTMPGL